MTQFWRSRHYHRLRTPYARRILRLDPIGYWPLGETGGSVAHCRVNSAQDAAYTGVSLNNTEAPDGTAAPYFDGTNDKVALYTATLTSAFDPTLGSMFIWAKVNAAAVWTDGVVRTALQLGAAATNRFYMRKKGANDTFEFIYRANSNNVTVTKTSISETGWMALALTWDKTGDQVKAYYNGAQEGSTQTGMDTYTGTLGNARTHVGADASAPTLTWHGWLAHATIWDRVLTLGEIETLSTV